MSIDRALVVRWLEAYVEAWKSYDRDQIAALFAEDVSYRYHPHDEPIVGREAVVDSWLCEGDHAGASRCDPEGTYHATYLAVAVDGAAAVATGGPSFLPAPRGPAAKVDHHRFRAPLDRD